MYSLLGSRKERKLALDDLRSHASYLQMTSVLNAYQYIQGTTRSVIFISCFYGYTLVVDMQSQCKSQLGVVVDSHDIVRDSLTSTDNLG